MSNRFHNKWHRASHHSYKNPNILDAGWDPIASELVPFSGDFVLSPNGSASDDERDWVVSARSANISHFYSWDNDPIYIHSDLNFSNDVEFSGFVEIKGNIDGIGLKVDNGAVFGSTGGNSSTTINGSTNVVGSISVTNGMSVSGKAVFVDGLSGDTVVDGKLSAQNISAQNNVSAINVVATSATIDTLTVKEIIGIHTGGQILYSEDSAGKVLPSSFDPGTNNFYLSGTSLYADSWAAFEGDVQFYNPAYFYNDVLLASGIEVAGTTLLDSVSVSGNAIIEGNLKLDGNLIYNGGLVLDEITITGDTELENVSADNIFVRTKTTTNTLSATSSVNIDGYTTLSGVSARGPAVIDNILTVSGDDQHNSLTVKGNVLITNGNITIASGNDSYYVATTNYVDEKIGELAALLDALNGEVI